MFWGALMGVRRQAAKRDGNEGEIIAALKAAGATVQQLSERGVPDLLIGVREVTVLAEVKADDGKLTPDQVDWHKDWRGQPVVILRSAEDAVDLVNRLATSNAPTLALVPSQPHITIIEPMTEPEARAKVMQINAHAAEMGRLLLELREREGWRVLGYTNWTECLNREFSYSRKHLYELMTAAPVIERLSRMGYTLSTDAANALAKYPAHMQPVIAQAAHVRGGITAGRVKRQGEAIESALTTGYTDTGSGDSIALDAALDLEEQEAVKRRKQYMADNQTPRDYVVRSVQAQIVQRGSHSLTLVVTGIDADLLAGLRVMDTVTVSVWRTQADAAETKAA